MADRVRSETPILIDYRTFMSQNTALVPFVRGTTDIYLILGDPVAQVKAPELFNLVFARLGLDAILVPAHVEPEHLDGFVRTAFMAKNIKGIWVAIPHRGLLVFSAISDGTQS
jgi:shikimate dehydrogenase